MGRSSVRYGPRTQRDEFWECAECRIKPGSPALCPSCLHNREVIDRLWEATSVSVGEPVGDTNIRITRSDKRTEEKMSCRGCSHLMACKNDPTSEWEPASYDYHCTYGQQERYGRYIGRRYREEVLSGRAPWCKLTEEAIRKSGIGPQLERVLCDLINAWETGGLKDVKELVEKARALLGELNEGPEDGHEA